MTVVVLKDIINKRDTCINMNIKNADHIFNNAEFCLY
jgi:hypothetical protein